MVNIDDELDIEENNRLDKGGDDDVDDSSETEDSEQESHQGHEANSNQSPNPMRRPSSQGKKNYITPKGMEALKAEYQKLFHVERPKLVEVIAWAASNGDRSENADYIYGKRRLREIDRRLGFLAKRMESAVVVDVKLSRSDSIVFGATVTLEDLDTEALVTYQLVGEDETEIEKGKISWLSPMGQSLLNRKLDEEIVVHRPAGEKYYLIKKIQYI